MSEGKLGICIDRNGSYHLDMEIRSWRDEIEFHMLCQKTAGKDAEPIILSTFQECFDECMYNCYLEYHDCRSDCLHTCIQHATHA